MQNRFFIRRLFACIIDWLILAILFAFIGMGLQPILGVKVIAPNLIKSTHCEHQDLIEKAQMDLLLPVDEGQVQFQAVCTVTRMWFFTHKVAILGRAVRIDGVKYNQQISYMIDENNQHTTYFSIDVLFYLFGPLLLSLWISKFGSTIGKKWLGLVIINETGENPTLKQALKREYLKNITFVASAIYIFCAISQLNSLSLEEFANSLPPLTKSLEENWLLYKVAGVLWVIAFYWFYFGSFIRWRDRTYWDRFAKLDVATSEDRLFLKTKFSRPSS